MSAEDWPVVVDSVFGCHLWTGKIDGDGYGIIWKGKRPIYAHKLVYETEVGPVPEGKVLDHECRRRRCCNPGHLEPVTQEVNQQRKRWATRVRRQRCRHGHDLHVHGMVTEQGGRVCRLCNRGQLAGPKNVSGPEKRG